MLFLAQNTATCTVANAENYPLTVAAYWKSIDFQFFPPSSSNLNSIYGLALAQLRKLAESSSNIEINNAAISSSQKSVFAFISPRISLRDESELNYAAQLAQLPACISLHNRLASRVHRARSKRIFLSLLLRHEIENIVLFTQWWWLPVAEDGAGRLLANTESDLQCYKLTVSVCSEKCLQHEELQDSILIETGSCWQYLRHSLEVSARCWNQKKSKTQKIPLIALRHWVRARRAE